jgi:hypothetical protein
LINFLFITDKPEIYKIPSTKTYPLSLRLIDSCGFWDTRGIEYNNKFIEDIKNIFDNLKIDNLKVIFLIFKASETREHLRIKYIINILFSSFNDDFLKNFIIIFTFADSLIDIPAFNILKGNLAFVKIFGNIENFPKFYFNNIAYFNIIDLFFIFFLSSIIFLDASKDIGLSLNIHLSNLAKFNELFSKETS